MAFYMYKFKISKVKLRSLNIYVRQSIQIYMAFQKKQRSNVSVQCLFLWYMVAIDLTHKWRQFWHSFVYTHISPTSLVWINIFFWKFNSRTRKSSPFWIRSTPAKHIPLVIKQVLCIKLLMYSDHIRYYRKNARWEIFLLKRVQWSHTR